VDCIYLQQSKYFLIAFSDSSLVAVPLDCNDVTLCEHVSWPKQPIKLLSSDGKTALVLCEAGFVFTLSMSAEGALPAAPR
jgi:hypothetical protein